MTDDRPERRFSSVDDFIVWEERQAERFEFLDGEVWSLDVDPVGMAGGTIRHNDIVFNIRTALTPIFRCKTWAVMWRRGDRAMGPMGRQAGGTK